MNTQLKNELRAMKLNGMYQPISKKEQKNEALTGFLIFAALVASIVITGILTNTF